MKRLLLLFLLLTAPLAASNLWCGGPLCQCDLSVAIKGGGAPTFFTHNGKVTLTDPGAMPPTFASGRVGDFNHLFDVPWTIGLEIALNLSSRIQFFFEYAYYQAEGKSRLRTFENATLQQVLFNYVSNNAYFGLRYYFNRWCLACAGTPIAPYIGIKAGIAQQRHINRRLFSGAMQIIETPFFRAQTAPSGSLFGGLEWWFAGRMSALVQVDLAITRGLRPDRAIIFDPPIGTVVGQSNGRTEQLISVPVTLGVRYYF